MPTSTFEDSFARRRKNTETASDETQDNTTCYTEEQLRAVEEINRCKDLYEILGVTKEAGESDLRKQYKRLALQFHPDKNKAPGSVEAFKAIGNAFAVLSDPVKRKRYDTYGLEAMQTAETHPTQEGFYYSTFEGDISAEELFSMFFNGNTYVRRGNHWQRFASNENRNQTYREPDTGAALIQILPLILIISISLLSSFFVPDPAFSLQRTRKYYYERTTSNLEVKYYVKDNFLDYYEDSLQRIERQVEDEYVLNIRSACYKQRNNRENAIWRAKQFRDVNLEQKAREMSTPSCDILTELYQGDSRRTNSKRNRLRN